MAENKPEKYDLYLTGQLADGVDKTQTLQRLATMFKRPVEKVAPLLAGKAHCIKRDLSKAELQRFQQVLDRIGVLNQGRLIAPIANTNAESISPDTANSALTLSPSGTPVLTEAERRQPPIPDIDTSAITLSPVGAAMGQQPVTAPPYLPSVDHLSLAKAGESLGSDRIPLPEMNLDDLSGSLSLAPSGARMSESEDKSPPPAPDISHLKLQP